MSRLFQQKIEPRCAYCAHGRPLTEEQVRKEASRCLKCGATTVDTNMCIGCGLCTTRCMFDAIHLERDVPAASTMVRCEDKVGPMLKHALHQVRIVRRQK